MALLGSMGMDQAAQVLQRLQILEPTASELLDVRRDADRAFLETQNGIALCWTKRMTSIGQVVDTRVLVKLDKCAGRRVACPTGAS